MSICDMTPKAVSCDSHSKVIAASRATSCESQPHGHSAIRTSWAQIQSVVDYPASRQNPKDDSLRLSDDPKLSDFQNQQQLEGQVLSLCAGFSREIEALLKNTDPSVIARCCPVNVLQMLSDLKRRSDILLEENLNLTHSLPPVASTTSRLNGERGSKRRRQTDEDVTGSSPFEVVSSQKPPKQSKGKRCCRSCGGFGHYLKTCSKTTSLSHSSAITRRITSNTKPQLIGSENGLSAGSVTRSSAFGLQHSHPTRCDNVTLGFDTSNDVAQPQVPVPLDCYVLVPRTPDFVRRYQQKMHRERVEIQAMEPAEKTIDFDELKRQRALGIYPNTENGAQAAAMLEALSRIYQVSCGWQGCAAVLNSSETLVTHLYENHMQECIEPSKCRWDGCGEEFSNRRRLMEHIDSHLLETIHCGYQDCADIFRTPRELLDHNLRHRVQRTALKPSTRPSAPQQLLPPPELGQNFPTWALLGPAVQIPGISKDRRKTLSAWVLRNIR
ncbi:hypothetical protein B0H11DRAFT_2270331 [Mycena galericulata]|nr:hypothetical protein B0H11DRAFT_2270331 [Mycena galericulata]